MKPLILAALAVYCCSYACAAADPSPLPRSRPEAQGVSPSGLLGFIEALEKTIDGMHGVVVVRHGNVVAEGWWAPYNAASPHTMFSLSKSFTSTAVGLAIADGKLSVDDEVLKFFPEDAPAEPSKNLKSMRVSDLLRMSTGHQSEPMLAASRDKPWTKTFLEQPVPFKPGTHFLYNTPATYMLSAIVQKVTGQTVLDYLKPRLFEPLGIENPTWGTSPQGISLGGYGLSIRTEDVARFGQLYLQKGKWQGVQLVPAAWVAAAAARQTSNGSSPASDWDQGYGYQFWRARHNAYRGDGAFGQYCVVLPDQDAVVAITSGVKDMQAVLNVVWDKLLPALQSDTPPTDDAANAKLKERLAGLSLRLPEGSPTSASASKVSGKTYKFPGNDRKVESVTLEDDGKGDATTLVLRARGVDQRLPVGRGAWQKGRLAYGPSPDSQPAASAGAWNGDDTYVTKVAFYETPFHVTLTLKFAGDEVTLSSEANVGFGSTKPPALTGKVQ